MAFRRNGFRRNVLHPSNTNQLVQSQKIGRSLKFWMKEEEGLCYPFSENKGADQILDYLQMQVGFHVQRLIVLQ